VHAGQIGIRVSLSDECKLVHSPCTAGSTAARSARGSDWSDALPEATEGVRVGARLLTSAGQWICPAVRVAVGVRCVGTSE
jgi:hypothetical protein